MVTDPLEIEEKEFEREPSKKRKPPEISLEESEKIVEAAPQRFKRTKETFKTVERKLKDAVIPKKKKETTPKPSFDEPLPVFEPKPEKQKTEDKMQTFREKQRSVDDQLEDFIIKGQDPKEATQEMERELEAMFGTAKPRQQISYSPGAKIGETLKESAKEVWETPITEVFGLTIPKVDTKDVGPLKIPIPTKITTEPSTGEIKIPLVIPKVDTKDVGPLKIPVPTNVENLLGDKNITVTPRVKHFWDATMIPYLKEEIEKGLENIDEDFLTPETQQEFRKQLLDYTQSGIGSLPATVFQNTWLDMQGYKTFTVTKPEAEIMGLPAGGLFFLPEEDRLTLEKARKNGTLWNNPENYDEIFKAAWRPVDLYISYYVLRGLTRLGTSTAKAPYLLAQKGATQQAEITLANKIRSSFAINHLVKNTPFAAQFLQKLTPGEIKLWTTDKDRIITSILSDMDRPTVGTVLEMNKPVKAFGEMLSPETQIQVARQELNNLGISNKDITRLRNKLNQERLEAQEDELKETLKEIETYLNLHLAKGQYLPYGGKTDKTYLDDLARDEKIVEIKPTLPPSAGGEYGSDFWNITKPTTPSGPVPQKMVYPTFLDPKKPASATPPKKATQPGGTEVKFEIDSKTKPKDIATLQPISEPLPKTFEAPGVTTPKPITTIQPIDDSLKARSFGRSPTIDMEEIIMQETQPISSFDEPLPLFDPKPTTPATIPGRPSFDEPLPVFEPKPKEDLGLIPIGRTSFNEPLPVFDPMKEIPEDPKPDEIPVTKPTIVDPIPKPSFNEPLPVFEPKPKEEKKTIPKPSFDVPLPVFEPMKEIPEDSKPGGFPKPITKPEIPEKTPPPPAEVAIKEDPKPKPKITKKRKYFRTKSEPGKPKLDIKKKIKKEKKYPTKIQWKDRDKYFTYNFNNQKQKMFNVPQGIGVNPGDTPAETLKIIQKKVAKPKTTKAKIGTLEVSISSPDSVVIRKLRDENNIIKNKRVLFRR